MIIGAPCATSRSGRAVLQLPPPSFSTFEEASLAFAAHRGRFVKVNEIL
jgi:hypothetical protein